MVDDATSIATNTIFTFGKQIQNKSTRQIKTAFCISPATMAHTPLLRATIFPHLFWIMRPHCENQQQSLARFNKENPLSLPGSINKCRYRHSCRALRTSSQRGLVSRACWIGLFNFTSNTLRNTQSSEKYHYHKRPP